MYKFVLVTLSIMSLLGCGSESSLDYNSSSDIRPPGLGSAIGAGSDPQVDTIPTSYVNLETDAQLETAVDYTWSVRARTAVGDGQWNTGLEFSIHQSEDLALADAIAKDDSVEDYNPGLNDDELPVPTVFSLSPIGSIVDDTPTFKWNPVVDAISYDIRIVAVDTDVQVFSGTYAAQDICEDNTCELPSAQNPSQRPVAVIDNTDNPDTDVDPAVDTETPPVGEAPPQPEAPNTDQPPVANAAEIAEIETLQQAEGVLAFPGALGYAKHALGGRGGRVVVVNTVDDIVNSSDNLMSLREATTIETGPRTIVFGVGGVFDTGEAELVMSGEADSNITVACQTAPAPGVTIRTYGFSIQNGAHDIIFRHCAIRLISLNSSRAQAGRNITVRGGSRNIMLDHMSFAWATDENFQAYLSPGDAVGIENMTLSNSAVVEGDADSAHPESIEHHSWFYHAMGPSCNNNNPNSRITGCSIVNNFIAHNSTRNAMIWGGDGELKNNIIYNWYGIGLTVQPHDGGDVNAIIDNNLMKSGPDTKGGTSNPNCGPAQYRCAMYLGETNFRGTSRFLVGNNYYIPEYKTFDDVELINHQNANTPAGTPQFDSATDSPMHVLDMAAVGSRFMACVGASRPERDHIDARVIQEFYDGTGSIGIGENNRAGGHNTNTQRTWHLFGANTVHPAGYDTDNDGMPNEWEIAYGLNPNNANDHSGDVDSDGYTNLEEYLAIAAHC